MRNTSLPFRNLLLAASLAVFTLGSLTSCQQEGCTDPESDNYDPQATVNDGSCIAWREKFNGSFTGNNACAGDGDQVTVITITPSANDEDAVVVSVPGADLLFTATVASANGLTIGKQTIPYQGSTVTISGAGTLKNGSELRIDYKLDSGPLTVPCTLTGNQL